MRITWRAGQDRRAAGCYQHPGDDDPAAAEARQEVRRRVRGRHDDQGQREERKAGLERRRAHHPLEVERVQEEGADQDPRRHQHDGGARNQRANPPRRRRDQGPGRSELGPNEAAEQGRAERGCSDRVRRDPAVLGRALDCEQQRDQTPHQRGRSGQVELTQARTVGGDGGDHVQRERADRDANRDVDEEHRAPAERVGEDAAKEDSGRGARTADRPPDSEGVSPLRAVVGGRDDRQCGRQQKRSAGALQCAARNQRGRAPCETAAERRRGEQRQAGHEDRPSPDEIGQAAAEQHEAAGEQDVRGNDPLQVAGEVKCPADGRQRHVDDGHVEDDHELRDRQQSQGGPRRPRFVLRLR
jgi:ribonuclease E